LERDLDLERELLDLQDLDLDLEREGDLENLLRFADRERDLLRERRGDLLLFMPLRIGDLERDLDLPLRPPRGGDQRRRGGGPPRPPRPLNRPAPRGGERRLLSTGIDENSTLATFPSICEPFI
jgi:hypothetical protein